MTALGVGVCILSTLLKPDWFLDTASLPLCNVDIWLQENKVNQSPLSFRKTKRLNTKIRRNLFFLAFGC